ncbi:type I restriction endonuclease [Dialister hominis]|uniref:type I restriction endonuclease n=1 Tax=Dialister hominis TaxID=2582419 RepID=UPI003FEFAD7B
MSNFSFLEKQFPLLAELGEKAEQYLYTDPNTTMFKLRSLGEKMVELMFQYDKEMDPTDHTQVARIRWLLAEGYLLPQEAKSLTVLRKLGNQAVHDDYDSLEDAKLCLMVSHSLCQWFMVTYGDYHYQEQPFVMPLKAAAPESAEAAGEMAAPMELTPEEEKLSRAASEKAKHAPKVPKKQRLQQNIKASNDRNISEEETRYHIDKQLRQVGWEVDSRELTYARGARPENHHNRAIAEWPTNAFDGTDKDGRRQDRADYALFIGKKLVGIIEAKRRFKNVSSVLDDQCHEYAAHIRAKDREYVIGTWGEYKVPFLFAANGRPYIEQCRMESGIWFRDVRKVDNAPKPLLGWMSPEGLEALLKQDISRRNGKLASLGDDILRDPDGLHLYPYQIEAVKRTEEAVQQGKDRILLAMVV